MKLSRVIAIAVIGTSLGWGAVHAQSFSSMDTPAEFPPASYSGKQYVDSRGCVYIRAGIDGDVTWVPRVSRDRKVICGFKPTFNTPVAGTVSAPKVDKNVVRIAPAAAPAQSAPTSKAKTSTTSAAAATVAPTVKASPQTKTTVKKTTSQTKSVGAPMKTTAIAVPPAKPVAAKAPVVAAPAVVAPNARRTVSEPPRNSGVSSPCRAGQNTYKGMTVRCGPQALSPVTPGVGGPVSEPPQMRFNRDSSQLRRDIPGTVVTADTVVSQNTRVLPLHVYEANLTYAYSAPVPEGYRLAFEDGRLNQKRALMTIAGKTEMDQIWTQTVPRRLIPRKIDDAPATIAAASAARAANVQPRDAAVVSTRSEPRQKSLRLAGTPYVQAGTFADATSAQAAAQKLRRSGLPVRIGTYERNGATQRLVLAGPFSTPAAAQKALQTAQVAGFGAAFIRQ